MPACEWNWTDLIFVTTVQIEHLGSVCDNTVTALYRTHLERIKSRSSDITADIKYNYNHCLIRSPDMKC